MRKVPLEKLFTAKSEHMNDYNIELCTLCDQPCKLDPPRLADSPQFESCSQ